MFARTTASAQRTSILHWKFSAWTPRFQRENDRKLTAAGGFALKSHGVVEETIDIGFGTKAWIFYVVETHNPLLGKDFFQHNFLTWKYVPDDGSRTIKLRVTDETSGNSIMVTDDHIGCNAVSQVTVSLTSVAGMSCRNFRPSLKTFTSTNHANIRLSITFPLMADHVLLEHAKLLRNTQILLVRKSTKC